MNLRTVPGRYGIARLPPEGPLPAWANGPGLTATIRAADELTILCAADRIPADVQADRGWACFRSLGPVPFDQPGVLHSLIAPISAAGIGVFVVCTFDGEHVLVPAAAFDQARHLLNADGHRFLDDAPGEA